jgi:inositol phosphorylceramide mannosyltransferase catalytic subunit
MACAVFHEDMARQFIEAHFGKKARSLFDLCFHHTMKADLFRLCYLYIHGGVYVDVDIDCHGPFTNILLGNSFRCFLFYAEGNPWCIENGFIAAEPRNGLIEAIIQITAYNLVQYRDRGVFSDIWTSTGPGVATRAVMLHLANFVLTGVGFARLNGLLMSRNDSHAFSYGHAELQYKKTAEGNWRKAHPPKASGRLNNEDPAG